MNIKGFTVLGELKALPEQSVWFIQYLQLAWLSRITSKYAAANNMTHLSVQKCVTVHNTVIYC